MYLSEFVFQSFKVLSSEHEARSSPDGSHLIALTSFSCPVNVWIKNDNLNAKSVVERRLQVRSEEILFATSQITYDNRRRSAHLTNMNFLISGAWSKYRIVLPIDIERRRFVKWKLLLDFCIRRVPNDRRPVYPGREDVFSVSVPFQGEDWPRMAVKVAHEFPVGGPYSCVAIVRSCR